MLFRFLNLKYFFRCKDSFFLKHANFLDCIPKIRSKIRISTIKKDFCGLSVAFHKRVSIIMLQKSSAWKRFCAEDL
jgi:hypothetical protein